MNLLSDEIIGPPDFTEFRKRREAELASPYGWLTLTRFDWLPESDAVLPGLPGTWRSDGENAYVTAVAADGLERDGEPVDGTDEFTVAETGRAHWLTTADGQRIELLRRGGRLAIRARAETSEERENFRGVPTYPHDPAWIIEGRFHPYPEGTMTEVGTHRPELRQRLKALGEVTFTAGGQPQKLLVTTIKAGASVEFHDPTNGEETPAWRQLKFDDPDEDGRVVLDFNRTIDMWFAFTDHCTCPRPSDGNTISVPVRAGEKKPL